MRFLILFILFLTGCDIGIENRLDRYKSPIIESEFQVFFDNFIEDSRDPSLRDKYTLSIIMVTKDDPDMKAHNSVGTSVGACLSSSQSEIRVVKVRQDYWERFNLGEKELLIYHELGHCLLNKLQHENEDFEAPYNFMKKSIMSAAAFSGQVYVFNRDYYVSDLFDREEEEGVEFDFLAANINYNIFDFVEFRDELYADYRSEYVTTLSSYSSKLGEVDFESYIFD